MKHSRVPTYYGFRIFFLATFIYYFLVTPFIGVQFLKYAPLLIEKGEQNSQGQNQETGALNTTFIRVNIHPEGQQNPENTLLQEDSIDLENLNLVINPLSGNIDTITDNTERTEIGSITVGATQQNDTEKNPMTKSFNLLLKMLIIIFLAGFLFNLPFKRYFIRKRKNKRISKKLFSYCKKLLLHTPWINSSIFFIAFAINTAYMIYVILSPDQFSDEAHKQIFTQFFYVSVISSLLSLLFVFFWQKHRVHIKYLEHIYTAEELRNRIFNFKVGKIRNRFLVSSSMTTLLPLTIVILYLLLSLTSVSDLGELTNDQVKILLGNYTKIFGLPETIGMDSPYRSLFYVNAIDNISMFVGIGAGIFISFIYIIFFVRWTTQDIVKPVQELLDNMRLTGEGNMNNFGIVRTNDEIGLLTEGYNDMSQKIKDYISNISRMNEAYARFVPRQFLHFLKKENFVDIKLGDQVQQEMTILFTDIRDFTEISESMTPKENFDFINHYLGYMEPVIRNNNGFIDKYIGDSIMALFPDDPGDAINAAIEMRIKLVQFNQVMSQFGKPEIDSGIGIHAGKLMLGIVGGEGRMDGTVISDAVNLASRLEGLTKIYGNAIIISEDTLIKIDDPSNYHYRFLDVTNVKGKKEAVYIFEIIDGEPEDIKQLKIETKAQFGKAINHYKNKQYKEALAGFLAIREVNMHDKAAGLYITRCEKFLRPVIPEESNGIADVEESY